MKVIISPAKKMVQNADLLPAEGTPALIKDTAKLMKYMQSLPYEEAKNVWKCSDKIALENYERFRCMELERGLTPAVLSYEGIQYQYMAPAVMEQSSLDYLKRHLRILSGFYGILRPFDGVVPYRLEMQAKLPEHVKNGVILYPAESYSSDPAVCRKPVKDLYQFWDKKIVEELCRDETEVLNLASKEYSRCVSRHLPSHVRMVDVVFGDSDGQNGVREKGTYAKMARGEMVNFMADRQIEKIEDIVTFDRLGYRFSEVLSSEDRLVFVRTAAAKV